MQRIICVLTICVLGFFPCLSTAAAADDPVLKTINEAISLYNNGQYSAALSNLENASQMIRQKKGDALGKLLPEPLPGWTAEKVDSKAMGAAMFGGATTAQRKYQRNDSVITVRFSTDSPMMQSMLMMFSNPIFASAGEKLELINGQKAVVDFKETSGSINMVVGNTLLITIEGKQVKRDDLIAYAKSIDVEKLSMLP